MAKYSDSVLDALVKRLDANGPRALRGKYIIGDPVVLTPNTQFPVCYVSRDRTVVSISTTHEDMHDMPVVLNVVYDGADDLNQRAFTQAGALALYDLCEGRDETYTVRSDTIAGVLRAGQALDGNNRLFIDVGTDLTIEYALSTPERRQIFSVEAIIRTTIKHLEMRP